MDKQTLRRIGWVGASLGLTSILVGCNSMQQSDSESNAPGSGASSSSAYLDTSNGLQTLNGWTDPNGLNSNNGLNANNGLNIANGFNANNGLNIANGLGMVNGFNANNGFNGNNGFNIANGFNANNGLNVTNGLNIANGLNTNNGLYSNVGYMTTEQGRSVVQYMARCALASGDSLVKQDNNNMNFTFPGGLGLAPEFKTAGCNKDCAEKISACMMAHINSSGTHIPLWMVSPDEGSVGWGTSPAFPTREGTFFGQIMVTNGANNIDGYFCNGPGADQNVVPGRLGSFQGSVPYANAWPTSAGFDGLCESAAPQHVNNVPTNGYDHGRCAAHTTNGAVDGDTACTLNGVVYNHPLTVWRGATYQAENGTGGAWLNNGTACAAGSSGCSWTTGGLSFKTACNPGDSGCAIIADSNNGMGKRVGYLTGASKGIKFSNVTAAASGTQNLIVYYTDGDYANITRYLSFSVNGGTAQVKPFGGLYDWSHPRGATISLSGWNAGGSNTVYVTADATHGAPDLDWIEVVGTSSSVPTSGLCDRSMWTVTSNDSGVSSLVDGNLTTRWTTGHAMTTSDYVQVDFQGLVKLSSLSLDNTQDGSSGDYPATFAVFSSQDGVNFGTEPMATGVGSSSSTTVSFSTATVRAIRIKVTGTRSPYWSIGELVTDCQL